MTYSVKKVSALDKLRPQGVVAPVHLEVKRKGLWEGVDVCMCGGEGWDRCVWEGEKGNTISKHCSSISHSAQCTLTSGRKLCLSVTW